jgi:hypothetical protein
MAMVVSTEKRKIVELQNSRTVQYSTMFGKVFLHKYALEINYA